MENVRIKVTTAVLQAKSGAVSKSIKNMQQSYDQLYRQIQSMAGYWEGKTSDSAMSEARKDRKDVQEMLRRLKEYPVDLLKISGNYQQAETVNSQTSQPLSNNVIF